MEEKILDIITECKLGEITTNEATRQVLDLFAVSGSVADAVGRNCPFCGEPCPECSHKATDR